MQEKNADAEPSQPEYNAPGPDSDAAPGRPQGDNANPTATEDNLLLSAESEPKPTQPAPGTSIRVSQRPIDGPSPNASEKAQSSGQIRHIIKAWKFELLACVLAVGMLFAISMTLYPFQGRPLPKWPYDLSINALVAIFTTLLKVALGVILSGGLGQLKWDWLKRGGHLSHLIKYDEASRDPLGCLLFLFASGASETIAIVGAILVVLTLVIDPFTQQLVRYYDCKIPSRDQPASVVRTSGYFDWGAHFAAGQTEINPQMLAAVQAGIFNPSAISVDFNCPSGNCTFSDLYSTVAYCASCTDTTGQLNISNNGEFLMSTLPSGASASFLVNGSGFADQHWFTMEVDVDTFDFVFAALPEDAAGYFALITDNPCQTPYETSTWACSGPGAASCAIYPCVKTFNASIQAGQLAENLISSVPFGITEDQVGPISTGQIELLINIPCLEHDQVEALTELGFNTTGSQWISSLPPNVTIDILNDYNPTYNPSNATFSGAIVMMSGHQNLTLPPQCLYEIDVDNIAGVSLYLQSIFSTSISPTANGDACEGSSEALAIFNNSYVNFDSIANAVDNLADSMSSYMRRSGYTNYSQPATGTTMETTTCMDIRWAWLTLPAVVTASGAGNQRPTAMSPGSRRWRRRQRTCTSGSFQLGPPNCGGDAGMNDRRQHYHGPFSRLNEGVLYPKSGISG
ncbi:hypothetical protein CLAIMM_00598 [Cladophialophora immunda]|nr:hypothetical protein CLAIMM_00598 [Cladophialophora immunda]